MNASRSDHLRVGVRRNHETSLSASDRLNLLDLRDGTRTDKNPVP
jgi:hypothetical protein